MGAPSGSLLERVALVTGAAGTIGSAICHTLAVAGCAVVVTYRQSKAEAKALLADLPGQGHTLIQADVTDTASLTRLAEQLGATYGRLDILVNNAGMTRFVSHDDLDALEDALIDDIFRTNWRGAFAAVRACRALLEASGAGVIVNISSVAGTTGQGSNVAYCASKAALDSLTRSLARALAPTIRVVSVAPGLVEGEYTKAFDSDWSQAQTEHTLLGRLASADEVAAAVYAACAYLTCSTGCVIPVDGGRPLGNR